jgi:hypothetical protein
MFQNIVNPESEQKDDNEIKKNLNEQLQKIIDEAESSKEVLDVEIFAREFPEIVSKYDKYDMRVHNIANIIDRTVLILELTKEDNIVLNIEIIKNFLLSVIGYYDVWLKKGLDPKKKKIMDIIYPYLNDNRDWLEIDMVIYLYNKLFDQRVPCDFRVENDELTPSEKEALLEQYNNKITYTLHNKHKPKFQFRAGDLIGAYDGKDWWAAYLKEILYTKTGKAVYYVEFLGWGQQFDMLIVNEKHIRFFNPRKHKYFIDASRRELINKITNDKSLKEEITRDEIPEEEIPEEE